MLAFKSNRMLTEDRIVSSNLNCWKAQFIARPIFLWIGALLLLPANASCRRVPRTIPDGLKVDHLGESLKEFKSVHREAHCHRAYGEWTEEDPKGTWLRWIHCSLEAGMTFGGQKLLSESEPQYPFGVYATFFQKRLVSITYYLDVDISLESLVSLIGHECSQPIFWEKDENGRLTGAYWGTKRLSVIIRSVPMAVLNDDNKTLSVTADIVVYARSVTILVGSGEAED